MNKIDLHAFAERTRLTSLAGSLRQRFTPNVTAEIAESCAIPVLTVIKLLPDPSTR